MIEQSGLVLFDTNILVHVITRAMLMTTDRDFDHFHPSHLVRTLYNEDGSVR